MSQQVSEDGGGAKEWYEQGSDILAAQNVTAQALFVGDAGGAAESPGDEIFQMHQAEFLETMGGWVQSGEVKYKEDLRPGGAEHAHAAMRAPRDFRATSRGTRIEVGCRAARRERP